LSVSADRSALHSFPTRRSSDLLTGSVTPTKQFEAWAHFGPVDMASDYWGNHLYVANAGSHDLSAYAIDRTTGKLTQISGSPYALDRKSTRMNSSHRTISYAVFC